MVRVLQEARRGLEDERGRVEPYETEVYMSDQCQRWMSTSNRVYDADGTPVGGTECGTKLQRPLEQPRSPWLMLPLDGQETESAGQEAMSQTARQTDFQVGDTSNS